MTTRTVNYIVSKALRQIGIETDYIPAPASAYERSFDSMIDMLDEWRSRGYQLFQNNPKGLNDTLSSAEPITAIVSNLAVRIAPEFLTTAGPDVTAIAGSSFQTIRNRHCRLPSMRKPATMPRGSGNVYPFYFIAAADSDALCNDAGAVLTVG